MTTSTTNVEDFECFYIKTKSCHRILNDIYNALIVIFQFMSSMAVQTQQATINEVILNMDK